MPESVPRIRLAAIPDDAALIVRGDELDPEILRIDAARFLRRFRDRGRCGVSAFLAIDAERAVVLFETRLARFETVVVFRLTDLVIAGVEVVPTFRRPHVTLAHTDLDALANGLLSCDHRTLTNPHFDGEAPHHD